MIACSAVPLTREPNAAASRASAANARTVRWFPSACSASADAAPRLACTSREAPAEKRPYDTPATATTGVKHRESAASGGESQNSAIPDPPAMVAARNPPAMFPVRDF